MMGVQIEPLTKKLLSKSPALLGLNLNTVVRSEGITILQKCFFFDILFYEISAGLLWQENEGNSSNKIKS